MADRYYDFSALLSPDPTDPIQVLDHKRFMELLDEAIASLDPDLGHMLDALLGRNAACEPGTLASMAEALGMRFSHFMSVRSRVMHRLHHPKYGLSRHVRDCCGYNGAFLP